MNTAFSHVKRLSEKKRRFNETHFCTIKRHRFFPSFNSAKPGANALEKSEGIVVMMVTPLTLRYLA